MDLDDGRSCDDSESSSDEDPELAAELNAALAAHSDDTQSWRLGESWPACVKDITEWQGARGTLKMYRLQFKTDYKADPGWRPTPELAHHWQKWISANDPAFRATMQRFKRRAVHEMQAQLDESGNMSAVSAA